MQQEIKETKVFALVLGDVVFIGRTTAQRVSSVCYSHIRGEHKQTMDYFGEGNKRPVLYVLDRITADTRVAYRYVVAWVHVFVRMGYHVINRGNVIAHAMDLHPETEKIVHAILAIPLTERLARGRCERYSDADSRADEPMPQVHKEPAAHATAKLTIRLTEEEKRRFDQVARSLRLTHRETLQYLIQFATIEDHSLQFLTKNYEDRLLRLKKRIAELEETTMAQREKMEHQAETHRKYVTLVRQGLSYFMGLFHSACSVPLTIERDYYDDYMRRCPIEYAYPEKEGFALIRPVAILRGRGKRPALFVLGVTAGGRHIKLRFYGKDRFVGMFLSNLEFGLRGSSWLVGWQNAGENVMQLMFALPVQIRTKYHDPMDSRERLKKMTEKYMDEE